MGCLEELNKLVVKIEDICRENDVECFIDIYKQDRTSRCTFIDFDCEI